MEFTMRLSHLELDVSQFRPYVTGIPHAASAASAATAATAAHANAVPAAHAGWNCVRRALRSAAHAVQLPASTAALDVHRLDALLSSFNKAL